MKFLEIEKAINTKLAADNNEHMMFEIIREKEAAEGKAKILTVHVTGDWKHDHLYFDNGVLASIPNFVGVMQCNEESPDESDFYEADHVAVFNEGMTDEEVQGVLDYLKKHS